MASDPTLSKIATLDAATGDAAFWLVWAARTAGIPLIITSALRTAAEQRRLVAIGRSRTMRSKHLKGRAFDVDLFGWNRDDVPLWVWEEIGPWAETQLGLRWGGRFTSIRDLGHFERP